MSESLKDVCEALVETRKRPTLLLKMDFIDSNCSLSVQERLKGKKFKKLDVILSTPGGDPHAAYQITKVIRKHADHVSIIVPFYAKSAGTLISLSANELILSEVGELGPLDIQVNEYETGDSQKPISALNGFKALEQIQLHAVQTLDVAMKMIFARSGMRLSESIELASEFCGQTSGKLYAQLDPKRIGEYARALDIGRQYALLVLERQMGWPREKASTTVEKLVQGYPSHDFVIDSEEAAELQLPVASPNEISDIVERLRIHLLKFSTSVVDLVEPKPSTPPSPDENAAPKPTKRSTARPKPQS